MCARLCVILLLSISLIVAATNISVTYGAQNLAAASTTLLASLYTLEVDIKSTIKQNKNFL